MKLRQMWWRLLDRIRPRYLVGVDPAYKDDWQTTVVTKWKRDGTVEVISVSHDERSGGE